MSESVQRVYLRTAAGEWHEGMRDERGLRTMEGCNLDDAKGLEEFPELPDDAEADQLCRRCIG